jgi:hypothetical protein
MSTSPVSHVNQVVNNVISQAKPASSLHAEKLALLKKRMEAEKAYAELLRRASASAGSLFPDHTFSPLSPTLGSRSPSELTSDIVSSKTSVKKPAPSYTEGSARTPSPQRTFDEPPLSPLSPSELEEAAVPVPATTPVRTVKIAPVAIPTEMSQASSSLSSASASSSASNAPSTPVATPTTAQAALMSPPAAKAVKVAARMIEGPKRRPLVVVKKHDVNATAAATPTPATPPKHSSSSSRCAAATQGSPLFVKTPQKYHAWSFVDKNLVDGEANSKLRSLYRKPVNTFVETSPQLKEDTARIRLEGLRPDENGQIHVKRRRIDGAIYKASYQIHGVSLYPVQGPGARTLTGAEISFHVENYRQNLDHYSSFADYMAQTSSSGAATAVASY